MEGIVVLEDVKHNREKWLQLKEKTIGSSDIVTVCGLNPYKSRLELWAEKTGRMGSDSENEYMRLGTYMEPFIGEMFGRKNEVDVLPANALYRHKKLDWAVASPDFFQVARRGDDGSVTGIDSVVECKNVNIRAAHQWEDGNVPNYAHMQVIWQLGVLGLPVGNIAALVGASPDMFFTPRIEFSQELFDQMLDMANNFLDLLRRDVPPGARAEDVKLLEKMRPFEEREVDLTNSDEAMALLGKWYHVSEQEKVFSKQGDEFKKHRKDYEARLLQLMAGANKAKLGEVTVTAKTINRAAYECKASNYLKVTIK